jgi:hypothetical protein
MVIERQLNGQVEQTFAPEGLQTRLIVPLTHERWPGGLVRTMPDLPYAPGSDGSLLPLRVLIGVDHVAGLVLGRPQDHLARGVAKLREVVAGDVLELGEELARLQPFAVLPERDIAATVGKL